MVDKDKLLKRMVDAMNDGGRCTNGIDVAKYANHNLSKSEALELSLQIQQHVSLCITKLSSRE